MVATPDVTDDFLEELTFLVEEALGQHAEAIAPGASASANFADRQIELDFIVTAESPEDLHRKLGEVIRIALAAIPPREPQQVAFAGSATSSALALA
jgi:L-fucose isomerase-like protein